ncbi:unnamed protein product [Oppiella nova]|uniref:UBC core domain-containing protein n=1 Tax=Oppiella nova TaxID=334625 RepID=A0A7R9QTA0_9ACAR|nr:unnamed protein product [Oppiella nova]CAG2174884.1 unnamed protein product [Oppiella nova]
MMAIRKLFRLKTGSSSRSVGSKDNSSKRSKKSSTSSSSPSSHSSSPTPHNSSSQSTRICLVSGHSTARNHQIVPTSDQPMSQSEPNKPSIKPSNCTIRSRRLLKEYRELSRSLHNTDNAFTPYSVDLVNDSLNEWNIKVYQFDTDSQFYKDMQELNVEYVLLNATFPENYPFAPPFVRVVSPHIEKDQVWEVWDVS